MAPGKTKNKTSLLSETRRSQFKKKKKRKTLLSSTETTPVALVLFRFFSQPMPEQQHLACTAPVFPRTHTKSPHCDLLGCETTPAAATQKGSESVRNCTLNPVASSLLGNPCPGAAPCLLQRKLRRAPRCPRTNITVDTVTMKHLKDY